MDSIFDFPIETGSSASSKQRYDDSINEPSALDDDFEYDFHINQLSDNGPSSTSASNQHSHPNESIQARYKPWGPFAKRSSGKSPAKSIDDYLRTSPRASTAGKVAVKRIEALEKSDSVEALGPIIAADLIRQLRLDDCKENQSLVRTAVARGYNIRDVLLAGLTALGKQDTVHSRSSFADPQRNALTLVPMSTLQAYLSNAVALKISIEEMHAETYPSPFYQPEALAAGNIAPLEEIWNDLPKDLRPTHAQISHPHHPWTDLISFPTLRERALTLASLTPPMIDIYDLKNDVFMNSGIFCWRTSSTGGTGQPWDMRSWEAEPWFLQKWWMLVGGEMGEVWQQTQWWRAMRGKAKVEMAGASK